VSSSSTGLVWGHSALQLVFDVSADGPVGVRTSSVGRAGDYALLSRMQLQSTSDQQDFRR